MIYHFDEYELDTGLYELRRSGQAQHLEPQVFEVLSYLVANRDRLVPKNELIDHVWGDGFISEAALSSRVMAARKAVGDSGREQRWIKTQHGRGFRFIGAVRDPGAAEPAALAPASLEDAPVKLRQEVRFCTAADGVRIAYASVGSGPVLVKAPNWLTHLEYEWQSPIWRHWWEELAQHRRLIRFDQRGSGLSDRQVEDLSYEAWISDLESVVDAAGGGDRFDLLGISQGGAVAVEYAIRHPERVRRLILYGAYTRGRIARGEPPEVLEAVTTLMRAGWGRDNPAYRQMFTSQFMPEAGLEQMNWFNELQRISTSGENAARIQEIGSNIDVLERLPMVKAPTLVLHATGDQRVPFDEGRRIATLIPNARLVGLESRNHLTLVGEPAWQELVAEVREFLAEPERSQQR